MNNNIITVSLKVHYFVNINFYVLDQPEKNMQKFFVPVIASLDDSLPTPFRGRRAAKLESPST